MNHELQEFTATVTAHQDPVYRLALATVRDADDAQDIAQEAFLRLWRKGRDVPPEAVRPWLLKVTHNLCLDHLRRRQRRHLRLGRPDPNSLERLPETRPDPTDGGLPDELVSALDQLSPHARSLVVLHYCEDMKLAEIAQVLETTTGAVKVALHRARRALQQALTPTRVMAGGNQETGT